MDEIADKKLLHTAKVHKNLANQRSNCYYRREMKAILSLKDICRLESYLPTDTASLALWNSGNEGEHVEIETGSDGNFKVITYFNQDISPEDKALVYKAEKGIRLTVSGPVYSGSAEWMKVNPDAALQKNLIDCLEIPAGNYIADIYSLLIKNPEGKPKYIQFVYCIFPENKYTAADVTPHTVTQALVLKYQG
jgi:hypothetical protein